MAAQDAGHVQTAPTHTMSATIAVRRAEHMIFWDISQFVNLTAKPMQGTIAGWSFAGAFRRHSSLLCWWCHVSACVPAGTPPPECVWRAAWPQRITVRRRRQIRAALLASSARIQSWPAGCWPRLYRHKTSPTIRSRSSPRCRCFKARESTLLSAIMLPPRPIRIFSSLSFWS